MILRIHIKPGILFLALLISAACATSPLGRKQLILVPDSQVNQMGAQAFQELKGKEKTDSDAALNQYVNCIVQPLTQAAKDLTPVKNWEVVLFDDPQANAFALPGAKRA